jgi:hypothetical protein
LPDVGLDRDAFLQVLFPGSECLLPRISHAFFCRIRQRLEMLYYLIGDSCGEAISIEWRRVDCDEDLRDRGLLNISPRI